MARTIQEIYDAMVSEKETMTSLNNLQPNIDSSQNLLEDLTSSSKVAIWRLLFFVCAVSIFVLEKLFDEHKAWINTRASELVVGSEKWYELKAREFQYTDNLVFNGKIYQYATINEANRIIKIVAAKQLAGAVMLKVAKLDGADPVPLTVEELDAFKAYIGKVRFAGIRVPTVSRNADELKVLYRVYYNPLLLNSSGELLADTAIKPVEDAINNYCKNLPFNGIFSVTEMTDKIQASIGVVNPVFLSGEVRYGATPWITLNDYYNPNAGYLRVSDDFPLSTTIEYIAQ
jgi:hypothetical protein